MCLDINVSRAHAAHRKKKFRFQGKVTKPFDMELVAINLNERVIFN